MGKAPANGKGVKGKGVGTSLPQFCGEIGARRGKRVAQKLFFLQIAAVANCYRLAHFKHEVCAWKNNSRLGCGVERGGRHR